MVRYELKKIFGSVGSKVALLLYAGVVVLSCWLAASGALNLEVAWVNEQGESEYGYQAARKLRDARKEWEGWLDEEKLNRVAQENQRINATPQGQSDNIQQSNIAYGWKQGFAPIRGLISDSYAKGFREYDYYTADRISAIDENTFYANRIKLLKAQNQIEDGKQQIEAGFVQLENKEKECLTNLEAVRSQLATAQAGVASFEANDIQGKYDAAVAAIDSAANAVAEAKQNYADAEANNASAEDLASLAGAIQAAEGAHAAIVSATGQVMDLYGQYQEAVGGVAYLQGLEATLLDGLDQIYGTRASLEATYEELTDAEAKLWISWAEWGEGRDEIAEGWIDYEEAKVEVAEELAEAEAELKDAEEELREAREDIDGMDKPDLIMLSRTSNVGYNNLDSSSNIVAGVARVLPVFFLLVASLVCITTMTRMIDEERTQIGTLKALGYSNAAIIGKYMFYSGSGAAIGCAVGVTLGSTIFPMILWEAYKIMLYITPGLVLTVNWWLCFAVVAVYVSVMLFVTWYCCRRTLKEEPAELIRPKAPDAGKKILLEYLPFWHKISFLNKVTIRNIFRYRQRLAMMLVGIGGCTALLVTGFGLRDSILNVVDYQFENVTQYDLQIYFRDDLNEKTKADVLKKLEPGAEQMFHHQSSVELQYDNRVKEIDMISAGAELKSFIHFRVGSQDVAMPGLNEVVLSVGVAEAMGIEIGETVLLRDPDMEILELTVSGIYDNHIDNFAIVLPETIAQQWGSEPQQQMAYVRLPDGVDVHAAGAHIAELLRTMLEKKASGIDLR